MHTYDLMVLLRTKESEALLEKVKAILSKFGVVIKEEPPWGVKKLAYEINRETQAYYYYAVIEASPDSVQKIIAEFRLNNDILRYLFVVLQNTKSA